MTLEDAYKIAKKKTQSIEEAVSLVEFYIKTTKSKVVTIDTPVLRDNNPLSQALYQLQVNHLAKATLMASCFIIVLKEAPEKITIPTYG